MTCDDIKARLEQVLALKYDRPSSTLAERVAIRSHIASCRSCERMVRDALAKVQIDMSPAQVLASTVIAAAMVANDDAREDPEAMP
jgi:hypothetical protein